MGVRWDPEFCLLQRQEPAPVKVRFVRIWPLVASEDRVKLLVERPFLE